MNATLGRTLLYTLTAADADAINRRRTNSESILERIHGGKWPLGAQAHIGTQVSAGDTFPMIVVRATAYNSVNGQVLLDGTDTLWAQDKYESHGPSQGCWHWPPRT